MVCRLRTAVASLVAEHRLGGAQSSVVVAAYLVAPQHVESSWGRDLEGKILTLGLPRQVLYLNFLISAML